MLKIIPISGFIGIDVLPKEIRTQLNDSEGDVEIQISSPGGFIAEGLEIYNLFKEYKNKVFVRMMGFTASIAAYISTIGDEVIVEDNAIFMIHNANGGAMGDHRDLRKKADSLEAVTQLIANAYVKRTSKSNQEILEMMNQETYLYGEQIIDKGFGDKLIRSKDDTDYDDLMASAKLQYENCLKSIKENYEKEDQNKINHILNLMNKKNIISKEVVKMNKEEILKMLNVMKQNNEITLFEIAKNIGLENQIITQDHTAALAVVNSLQEEGISDPVSEIKRLKNQISENEEATFNATMTEKYGAPHSEKKPNYLRQYAENMLEGKTGEVLNTAIEDLKKDPIALNFAAQKADQNSETNDIGRVENINDTLDNDVVVMKY